MQRLACTNCGGIVTEALLNLTLGVLRTQRTNEMMFRICCGSLILSLDKMFQTGMVTCKQRFNELLCSNK